MKQKSLEHIMSEAELVDLGFTPLAIGEEEARYRLWRGKEKIEIIYKRKEGSELYEFEAQTQEHIGKYSRYARGRRII